MHRTHHALRGGRLLRLLALVTAAIFARPILSQPVLAQAPTRGTLFIVGGGSQPAELVEEFVRLAGGPGKARIVVFAMASASGERSGEEKAMDLRKLGAEARNVWISRQQADRDSIVHLLDSATGIWFGGGDQNRLTDALLGSKVERAIHARYAAGAVVGGTSAGAAVMSSPMITGTELLQAGESDEAWTRVKRGTVAVDRGFAFLTDAIIDQHFLRRKRQNRLLSLVLASAPYLGAGIDEGTAIIVDPDGMWRIMGASAVLVVDARDATRSAEGAAVLGATGVTMHLLPSGATFDPRTGIATLRGTTEPGTDRRRPF
ncbi:MAG: cyanophycinase [Gemmatimonadota bacterium]